METRPAGAAPWSPWSSGLQNSTRQTQLVFIGREADATPSARPWTPAPWRGHGGAHAPAGPEPLTSRVEVILKR